MLLREEIANQARALSPSDRADLVEILESSLEEDGFADASIGAAWRAEVQRRLGAYDRGQADAAGLSEAMTAIRERFQTAPGKPDR
ncbi:MAG: addiction module protein [Planctomycetaceae bacterium]